MPLKTLSTVSEVSADLHFHVEGIPRAKPRQSRRDRFEPSRAVQFYHAWADCVRMAARSALHGPGLSAPVRGPVALAAIFTFPVPQSWTMAKRRAAYEGTVYHTSKPDLDNLIKGLKDPLSGILWKDDRQVVCYAEPMCKQYGSDDQAGCRCWIWNLEE